MTRAFRFLSFAVLACFAVLSSAPARAVTLDELVSAVVQVKTGINPDATSI